MNYQNTLSTNSGQARDTKLRMSNLPILLVIAAIMFPLKGMQYGCGYYPILPRRMGRPDLVEKVLPQQTAKVPMTEGCHSPRAESSTLQGQGVFAQAVQASLLLAVAPSPVGASVIHVMEGWPRKWDVSFQLQSKGGFLVSSE